MRRWRRSARTRPTQPTTSEAGPPEQVEPGLPDPIPLVDVRNRTDALLVDTDTVILASRGELDALREAEGDRACAPFEAAVAAAAADLQRAVELRDLPAPTDAREADPGATEAAERDRLQHITELCRSAQAHLDEQAEAFDTALGLERRVEQVLTGLTDSAGAVIEELQRGVTTVADLRSRYPAMALAALQANLAQADERLRLAFESVQAGLRDLAQPDRRWAVARALTADECLRQAHALIAGVQQVPDIVAQAEGSLTTLLADTEEGIAESQAVGAGRTTAEAFARDTVDWARRASDTGSLDPIATRRALEDTGTALSVGLGTRRAAEQTRARALVLLDSARSGADSSLRAATCFISTRRGVVGAEARWRLALARRLVESASGRTDTDPEAAVAQLRQADALAEQALQLAQQDEARAQNEQRILGTDPRLIAALVGGILVPRPGTGEKLWSAVSFGGTATRARWALLGLD